MTRVVNVDGKNYTVEECMGCMFYHDGGPERPYCCYPARKPRKFEGPGPFIDGIVDSCPLNNHLGTLGGAVGMTELKPCPFCGCELEFKRYTRGYPIVIEYFDIRHPDNGCILSDFDDSYTDYDALLKQWNRRVKE